MQGRIALIPAYEPSATLVTITEQLYKKGYKIIIVDDGSGSRYESVFNKVSLFATLLKHETNRGKGSALKTGLSYIQETTSGDAIIVTLDADGQHSIEDAGRVCKCAEHNSGRLVLGSRMFTGKVPMKSKLGNAITRVVYRIFTGISVNDTQTGLRAFHIDMIPFMLGIEGKRYEYEMEVLLQCARQNIPIIEIEIDTIYDDDNSSSHFNAVKDSYRVYKEILKFSASSFISFIVDYSLYIIFLLLTGRLQAAVSIPLSNILARIISAATNFSINRNYVFKSKDNVFKSAILYVLLACCILAGNTCLLTVLVNIIGINKFIAKIFTEITFFIFSILVQKFIIFKKKESRG
ncbi:MAG: GtrA family protein [Eubacterium sp.]